MWCPVRWPLQSGVDVGLWDEAFGKLEEAVRRGLVKEAQIDQAVLRVLTLKFERDCLSILTSKKRERSIWIMHRIGECTAGAGRACTSAK